MRYEQLHNILHHLAPAYHRKVSDYYQALADGDVSPRVQLMLDYLIDHEQHRALALAEFSSINTTRGTRQVPLVLAR